MRLRRCAGTAGFILALTAVGGANAKDVGSTNVPQANPVVAENEFRVKRDFYETRFADYYTRLLELDRMAESREMGAEEARMKRKKIIEEYEKTRREYARTRRAKPEIDPSLHEKELKERERAREIARKDYLRRKQELNKVMKRTSFIPEEEELGLQE